jgi:hypothetical protein
MPEISRFFGIVISMYHDDHPPPHFHATHAEHEAVVGIDPPRILEGSLPPRALGLVMEWAALHTGELSADFEHARARRPLVPIEPLR